jgi:hypothetical protein
MIYALNYTRKTHLSKNFPIFFWKKTMVWIYIYMEAAFLDPQVSYLHTAQQPLFFKPMKFCQKKRKWKNEVNFGVLNHQILKIIKIKVTKFL